MRIKEVSGGMKNLLVVPMNAIAQFQVRRRLFLLCLLVKTSRNNKVSGGMKSLPVLPVLFCFICWP
jgi:hypothetical protein